jgi:peptide/nickel transport system ATP-binding protein
VSRGEGFATSVRDLRVELLDGSDIVDEVGFDVAEGELLALVGESGCGKTATAMACLGYARPGSRIARGQVIVGGVDLISLSSSALRRVRGKSVSYVPQDPSTALNPSFRIGDQVMEMFRIHGATDTAAEGQLTELLQAVGLPSERGFVRRYPHQLSGGQQQRVVIMMAIACRPRLIVLDEPTTGLDVTTQAQVLAVINELRQHQRLSMLYVTHDLGVVAQLADRIAVMYCGRIVEIARREDLFRQPRHPYTQGLLEAAPTRLKDRLRLKGIPGMAAAPGERPSGCFFAPRCAHATNPCLTEFPPTEELGAGHTIRCYNWRSTLERPGRVTAPLGQEVVHGDLAPGALLAVNELVASYPGDDTGGQTTSRPALAGISLLLGRRETLAIVGESGSGKTTLARCIVGLHRPVSGTIIFQGAELPGRAVERSRDLRRRIQLVFQNPDASLNPRQSVAQIIERPLRLFIPSDRASRRARSVELLELVRLPVSALNRFPSDLSGGEKQRVAIARALAPRPELIICDEITSALDVSVQAAIIDLLMDLRLRLETSFLYISHDLAVVRSIADRVLVLQHGVVCEEGDAEAIFRSPTHPYTSALLDAVPEIPDFSSANSAGIPSPSPQASQGL